MKKVNGNLRISVNVECPECGEVIDLMSMPEFTDDGWLYEQVLEGEDGPGCDELNDEITCQACKTPFEIVAIDW